MKQKFGWREFFDGHAPEYDDNCFTKNTLAEVEFIEKKLELSPGASILDVGCGTGRHAVELARMGYRVTGLDLSPGMLAQAKKRADAAEVDVRWVESDATRFSFDEKFDAAICLCEGAFGLLGTGDDSIEHPMAILNNIADSMAPGARCLFTVLNGYRFARMYSQQDVESNRFDPIALVEISEVNPEGESAIRERGFVPTELALMFRLAGLKTLGIWGGTAGDWGERQINLDEYEIMIFAQKT